MRRTLVVLSAVALLAALCLASGLKAPAPKAQASFDSMTPMNEHRPLVPSLVGVWPNGADLDEVPVDEQTSTPPVCRVFVVDALTGDGLVAAELKTRTHNGGTESRVEENPGDGVFSVPVDTDNHKDRRYLRMRARASGYLGQYARVDLSKPGRCPVTLALMPASTMAIDVFAEDNSVVTAPVITIDRIDQDDNGNETLTGLALSEPSHPEIERGKYLIYAHAPREGVQDSVRRAVQRVELGEGEHKHVTMKLERVDSFWLRGRVVDIHKRPVTLGELSVVDGSTRRIDDSQSHLLQNAQAVSLGDNGDFEIEVGSGGPYTIRVHGLRGTTGGTDSIIAEVRRNAQRYQLMTEVVLDTPATICSLVDHVGRTQAVDYFTIQEDSPTGFGRGGSGRPLSFVWSRAESSLSVELHAEGWLTEPLVLRRPGDSCVIRGRPQRESLTDNAKSAVTLIPPA